MSVSSFLRLSVCPDVFFNWIIGLFSKFWRCVSNPHEVVDDRWISLKKSPPPPQRKKLSLYYLLDFCTNSISGKNLFLEIWIKMLLTNQNKMTKLPDFMYVDRKLWNSKVYWKILEWVCSKMGVATLVSRWNWWNKLFCMLIQIHES